jgi:hypothetical protein
MTALRGRCAAFVVAVAASGCVTAPLTLDEPAVASAVPLPPWESRDVCVRLGDGDRLDYTFESTEPVAFEIRYREGAAVIAPLVRDPTRTDAGVFVAGLPRDYCLVWEAGVAGALLDYRLRRRPAAR